MSLLVYRIAVFLRVVCALFVDSYIHPDEHFQCGEVASSLYLGNEGAHLPWEYIPGNLARSYLPVEMMCGVPFSALAALKKTHWMMETDGRSEIFFLRIWMLFLSLVSDRLFVSSANALGLDWHDALAIRAFTWVSILMSTRTFSNVLEGLIFDLLLFVASCVYRPLWRSFYLGIIFGLGCFVRITFPAFAGPTIIFSLWKQFTGLVKRQDGQSGFLAPIVRMIPSVLMLAIGGILAASACIAWDTRRNGEFIVGPWVNLLYNANPSNLAKHGVHPWFTHILVNLQLMFAPMSLLLLASLRRPIRHASLLWSIALPLMLLSAFPHQEFRFLYPMLTPLALIASKYWDSKIFRILHMLFALVITGFFALHQGNISTALRQAGIVCSQAQQPCCITACNVYMAPTYLLGDHSATASVYDSTLSTSRRPRSCSTSVLIEPLTSPCDPGNKPLISKAWTVGRHWNAEAGGLTSLRLSVLEST
jgi:phosphatidylinositol glycan class Z